MKYYRLLIAFIFTVFINVFAFAQQTAGENRPYFSSIRSDQFNEYAYMSPVMLKTMSLNDKDLEGLPARKVKMIEIVSIKFSAKKTITPLVEKCIKENGMELVGSTSKNGIKKDVYANVIKDEKIKSFLILKWGQWRESVKALYVKGDFNIEELKSVL